MREYCEELIRILGRHDPQKGDLSFRAEGTLEAITALGRNVTVAADHIQQFGAAIIDLCKRYNQFEMIGRGTSAVAWPTNRFAVQALEALGVARPAIK